MGSELHAAAAGAGGSRTALQGLTHHGQDACHATAHLGVRMLKQMGVDELARPSQQAGK